MDITKYKTPYEAHDSRYEVYLNAYKQAGIQVRFPVAHEILLELTDRTDQIYKGMLLMGETNNLTSLYILYRSLIDHFIKIQYIQDKTFTGLSDETANNYKIHYFVSEFLGEQGGILEMELVLDEKKPKPDKPTFIQNRFPELAGFDKANERDVNEAVRQFGLTAMVKHLTDRYNGLPNSQRAGNILAQTLPEFAHVSSFTHGGPYAGQILKSIKNNGTDAEQIDKQLQICLTMLGTCKENNFLVFEIDQSNKAILLEMQGLRTI
jgi:hypothetical protein